MYYTHTSAHYSKSNFSADHPNIKVTRYEIEQVYKLYIRQQNSPKEKKVIPRCRYQIDKVNGAWHGDIHYLIFNGEQKYLFALMDDRSRFIVGHKIIDDKTAKSIKEVFHQAVKKYASPLIYWADNGKENTAILMKNFLLKNQIHLVTIVPGNPQSNGKIERFWVEVDKRIKDCKSWEEIEEKIDKFINNYNNHIPHHGLEKDERNIHKVPASVFLDASLQATTIEHANIEIDGKAVFLPTFLKLDPREENLSEIEEII